MWAEGDWIKLKNKIAVTHAWEASADSRRSSRKLSLFGVILKYLKLYCQHSSLVGFKYLADTQRTWFERLLWVVIHCTTICSLLYIVYNSYVEFVTSPILTSMDTDKYYTTMLTFPGVAICPINRISLRAATKMATEIYNANVTDLSKEEILNLVGQLRNQYSTEFNMDEDRNLESDQLLTTYYQGDYDITEILKSLTPLCSAILLKCKLHGIIRDCKEIFEFRKTQDGFCCTFNYVREEDDIPVLTRKVKQRKPYKVKNLGIDRGLSVLMEPLLDDYFCPMLPVKGWKIILFNADDFPDQTSGGVTEILSMPLSETYVDVTATSFFSTKIIKKYPIEKRKCILSDELLTTYSGSLYTYSDCIVDCKIHDIQKLCGCRPFFYPRRGKREYSLRVCNNADVECLTFYKSKWWTVYPYNTHQDTNEEHSEWALHCHTCYPLCDDISYDVLSSKSYMSRGLYKTEFLRNVTVKDQAILHIYFSKYGSIRLKQDVVSYWYELISDIGGICGVFIGFSLISIVELLYFVILTFRELCCKKWAVQDDDDDDGDGDEKNVRSQLVVQPIQAIYWNELLPRPCTMTYGHQFKQRVRPN